MPLLEKNTKSTQLADLYTDNQFSMEVGDSPDVTYKIGRYILKGELGRGGMGKVYLAYDPFIDRKVAIKTALTTANETHSMEEIQQNFFNEARVAGKLMHPNIVALYDALSEKNIFYLVMEYIEGKTLKEYCASESDIPFDKAINIIFQCAKALDYAHKNGIIHRDIKPSNILISSNGEVKISDFSIAVIEGFSNLDNSGSFTGSVYYTAPELLREEHLTAQSDLFSLGVVMYEILSGEKPFEGDSEIAIFYKILNNNPEPLRRHRKDIPEPLERIVSRALEKDPSGRYKSGAELASDLSDSYDKIRFIDEKINFQERYIALKKLNFFKDFSYTELNEVINATLWLEYESDVNIITEGEMDDCFYIIIMGEVAVSKEDKPLALLKQGDCFGEMAYLGRTKRTANIKALSKTILMKINASIMEETSLFTQNRFYKVFSQTLIQRLERANQIIAKETRSYPKKSDDKR